MFSGSETYRISAIVRDAGGRPRRISPTEVAAHASGGLALFLTGAERWRRAPVARTLASHLARIAVAACETPGAGRVSITLEYRISLDAPIEVRTTERACAPDGVKP